MLTLALFYVFAVFGLWWICGRAEISKPFRDQLLLGGRFLRTFVSLIECPGCFAVWVALACCRLPFPKRIYAFLDLPPWLGIVMMVCATAGTTKLLGSILDLIDTAEDRLYRSAPTKEE